MSELVLKSNKSNIFGNILRYAIGGFGVVHLALGLSEIILNGEYGLLVLLNAISGIVFIGLALSYSTRKNIEMHLNDEFIQTTKDLVRTKTAYWGKVDEIVLTKSYLQAIYRSGIKKKLPLPALKDDNFQELREELVKISENNDLKFREKTWWNFLG